ncbi:DUF983 domain-containing protein [Sphingobacterium deserti]|uniref:DUF983 domain-containing protein n=1 Tax=Sphingobacterium deserti TaxID=1229276 RepID=A0A0B8TA30_9SPHI|nr:DUF983 domain-containing protein [Sphingobacterium deserti]KGE15639.1 hypothetical protein DI53_0561 [Sphingobacterium deserti]
MSTSKFSALLQSKCPRCRVGKMFEGPIYGFKKQTMHERCPHCGLKFEIEPGYFYAAMYVSYAFSVAEVVSLGLATAFLTKSESPWLYIIVLFSAIFLFAPFNLRFSRLVLLHYLSPKVSYNPQYERNLEK